jgi:hypothetical protein
MAPVRFRGTPLALSAVFPTDEPPREALMVRLEAEDRLRAPLEIQAVPSTPDPILRMHLPRNTPPGDYEGRMRVGNREQSVLITVEPEIFLRLLPERLVFEARAGDRVPFELTMLNLGNVAVEIRGAYAFGVFEVAGAERAIAKMVTETPSEGRRRLDVLADAVADEHGGLVRVKVESGGGELAPGETRDIRVTLHVPDRIHSGHTYWGTWPIHNMRYYVRISGQAGEPRTKASHERQDHQL